MKPSSEEKLLKDIELLNVKVNDLQKSLDELN